MCARVEAHQQQGRPQPRRLAAACTWRRVGAPRGRRQAWRTPGMHWQGRHTAQGSGSSTGARPFPQPVPSLTHIRSFNKASYLGKHDERQPYYARPCMPDQTLRHQKDTSDSSDSGAVTRQKERRSNAQRIFARGSRRAGTDLQNAGFKGRPRSGSIALAHKMLMCLLIQASQAAVHFCLVCGWCNR
jgi:hypothetical protein